MSSNALILERKRTAEAGAFFKHALAQWKGCGYTVKNTFFTDKFVLTPKFAGVGSMEDFYDKGGVL